MTNYTFKINGYDFSGLVDKYGYSTDRVPIESDRVRTLDGIDHVVIIRHKGTLTVAINPQASTAYADFCEQLSHTPMEVEYTCLQTGADVVQSMTVSGMPLAFALKNANRTVLDKLELTFEQL